jgi:hypothetical protein
MRRRERADDECYTADLTPRIYTLESEISVTLFPALQTFVNVHTMRHAWCLQGTGMAPSRPSSACSMSVSRRMRRRLVVGAQHACSTMIT